MLRPPSFSTWPCPEAGSRIGGLAQHSGPDIFAPWNCVIGVEFTQQDLAPLQADRIWALKATKVADSRTLTRPNCVSTDVDLQKKQNKQNKKGFFIFLGEGSRNESCREKGWITWLPMAAWQVDNGL